MDRAQVNAAMPYLAPASAAPSHGMLLGRLSAYWRALGVSDPDQIAALSEQALRRGIAHRVQALKPERQHGCELFARRPVLTRGLRRQ